MLPIKDYSFNTSRCTLAKITVLGLDISTVTQAEVIIYHIS